MKPGDLVRVLDCDDKYEHDEYSGQVGILVDIDSQHNEHRHWRDIDVYVVMLDGGEKAYFYEHEIELVSECDEDV
jgi:hypothetical protein